MTKEDIERQSIYNIKLNLLKNVLPLSEEEIKEQVMPVFYDLFEVFFDVNTHIQKMVSTMSKPVLIKNGNLLSEKLIENVCKYLEENTQTINNGSTHCVVSKEKITQQEFIEKLKKELNIKKQE